MRRGDREDVSNTGLNRSAELDLDEDLLDEVNGHIDEIHRELAVQVKRTHQIQEQLGELRLKLARLARAPRASSRDDRDVPERNNGGPPEARTSS